MIYVVTLEQQYGLENDQNFSFTYEIEVDGTTDEAIKEAIEKFYEEGNALFDQNKLTVKKVIPVDTEEITQMKKEYDSLKWFQTDNEYVRLLVQCQMDRIEDELHSMGIEVENNMSPSLMEALKKIKLYSDTQEDYKFFRGYKFDYFKNKK